MNPFRLVSLLLFSILLIPKSYSFGLVSNIQVTDTSNVDRDYTLEATMLGYFDKDGTRNPVLRANKGDVVRVTIINGELMTHDIALEKLGIKSDVLVEEGDSTSITFTAEQSDIYYCTIPGHRAAGMVGQFEVVEGPIKDEETFGDVAKSWRTGP